jgi:hypothetical protein
MRFPLYAAHMVNVTFPRDRPCVRFPCVHAAATTPAQRLDVSLRSFHPDVAAFPERVVGTQPDPHARDILGYSIPQGSRVYGPSTERCTVWNGSGRNEIDADNWWCPVYYNNQKGWANAFYLMRLKDGIRQAFAIRPDSRPCQERSARFSNSGSLATLAAMRRASSRVGKLAGQKQRALGGQLPRALCARSFTRRVRNDSHY